MVVLFGNDAQLKSFELQPDQGALLLTDEAPSCGRCAHQHGMLRMSLTQINVSNAQTLINGLPNTLKELTLDHVDLEAELGCPPRLYIGGFWPSSVTEALVAKISSFKSLLKLSMKTHCS